MRVILTNNYDLSGILRCFRQEQGNTPAQHLWGYPFLEEQGMQVDILQFQKYGWLKQLSQKIKFLGDLDQQLTLLLQLKQYDLIYSAHHLTTLLLAFLRSIKLLNKPIVAIAYQVPAQKNWFWKLFTKLFVTGNDKILCLSEALAQDLKELGVPVQKLDLIGWGVDLRFYQPAATQSLSSPTEQPFILSVGKTYRDYPTLLVAFQQINGHLTICAPGAIRAEDIAALAPMNVNYYDEMMPWQALVELYQQAYAVVIPLMRQDDKFNNAIGLTAVTEAMAVGKAIVMTRNDYIGIDLEKEGIGIWVEPGDSEGWLQAISYLLENPEVTQEMGRKARLLAERKFNLTAFSNHLAATIQQFELHPSASQPENLQTKQWHSALSKR